MKHLWDPSSLIKLWSNISTSVGERSCIFYKKGDIFLISFLVVRCRSELSGLMEMNTGADPLARSTHVLARECTADSPFPLLLLLCHLSISPMVSSNGLLLHCNRFHLPIKPSQGAEQDGEQKTVRAWAEGEQEDFFSLYNTNTSPPSAPLVPRQNKPKCCRVTLLFLSNVL